MFGAVAVSALLAGHVNHPIQSVFRAHIGLLAADYEVGRPLEADGVATWLHFFSIAFVR